MWHALRAELAYSRPYLLGGLGIALGVTAIVSAVFYAVGESGPPSHAAAGIRGMFLALAPLIVAFIVQANRVEERRALLLLAGPLSPRQLATVTVALPVVLFGVAVCAAGAVVCLEALVTGRFALESLSIAGLVGVQLFLYTQLSLLAQETAAARRQQRQRAATAGWVGFFAAVLFLVGLYAAINLQLLPWLEILAGHLVLTAALMAATVTLYTGRTDFTR